MPQNKLRHRDEQSTDNYKKTRTQPKYSSQLSLVGSTMIQLVLIIILNICVCVLWLFLRVPWIGLQSVIVAFPGHTHLLVLPCQSCDSKEM